jgi:hypothetical protein
MSVRPIFGSTMLGLVVGAALVFAAEPAPAEEGRAAVADIVALCTAADTLTLDPDAALRRMAFRRGKPERTEDGNRVTYDLIYGMGRVGHIDLRKTAQGWQVDLLLLAFSDDEKLSLKALSEPLTKSFGAPQDVTTGNTVLMWRGRDRLVRVSADVPGNPNMFVYVVQVARRR